MIWSGGQSLGHTVEVAALPLDAEALGDAMFATIALATAIPRRSRQNPGPAAARR